MILAGDIGGTKTNLALFVDEEKGYEFHHLATFSSQKYPDLKSIVQEFLKQCEDKAEISSLKHACFAIAGPVLNGVCKATNLPWVVDSRQLSTSLNIPNVFLINDLEANASAIDILEKDALFELYSGKGIRHDGNKAVLSPGTGLGEAALYWDGKLHHPFACEGGHCEFGPRDELQIDLCRYIYQKFGHASYERILSGPGLYNIYLFYRDALNRHEPDWLIEEMSHEDPAKVITINALNGKSDLCNDALNLFVSIFGSEASNCVLKFMAVGGIYLGGGIPPKILDKLKEPVFLEGYLDKGRFRELMEEVPIYVILDDKASLKGAAHYCRLKMLVEKNLPLENAKR